MLGFVQSSLPQSGFSPHPPKIHCGPTPTPPFENRCHETFWASPSQGLRGSTVRLRCPLEFFLFNKCLLFICPNMFPLFLSEVGRFLQPFLFHFLKKQPPPPPPNLSRFCPLFLSKRFFRFPPPTVLAIQLFFARHLCPLFPVRIGLSFHGIDYCIVFRLPVSLGPSDLLAPSYPPSPFARFGLNWRRYFFLSAFSLACPSHHSFMCSFFTLS